MYQIKERKIFKNPYIIGGLVFSIVLLLNIFFGNKLINKPSVKIKRAIPDTSIAGFIGKGTFANKYLLVNWITLKDGQSQIGGITFLYKKDTSVLAISTKNVVAESTGFTYKLSSEQLGEHFDAWRVISAVTGNSMNTLGMRDYPNRNLLTILNVPKLDTTIHGFIRPSSIMLFDTVFYAMAMAINSPKKNEQQYPLKLYKLALWDVQDEYLTFICTKEYEKVLMYGQPIVDRRGGAIAVVLGKSTELDVIGRSIITAMKL